MKPAKPASLVFAGVSAQSLPGQQALDDFKFRCF